MGVERQGQRGTFLNQSHSGVAMTVDSPFVSLGETEPTFQVKVVLRQVDVAPRKQSGLKAGHHFGHLLVDRIRLGRESLFQICKLLFSVITTAGCRIQRVGDGLKIDNIFADGLLRLLDLTQSPIDALR